MVEAAPQLVERVPARVAYFKAMTAVDVVAVGAAFGAETGAVEAAQRCQGELQQERLADQRFEVELVAFDGEGVVVVRLRLVQLPDAHLEAAPGRAQAATAGALPRGRHPAGDDHAV